MKVSIIFLCHNRLSHLKRTVDSVFKGDVEYELVFADHASTDGTEEWVKQHHPDATYLYVPEFPEGGCRAKVINMGVAVATHDILVIQGGEMLHENDVVPLFLRHFQKHKRGILVTPYTIIYEQFGIRPHEQSRTRRFSCTTIHRDDFIEIGGMNEYYTQWGNEDVDFHIRCEAYGYKIIDDHDVKIRHYAHGAAEGGDQEQWKKECKYLEDFTAEIKAGASPVLSWKYGC